LRGFFSRTGQRYFTDKLEAESLARHGWMDIENQSFISGMISQCTIHRTQYSISQQQNLEIKINCSATRADRAIIYSEWPLICIVSDVVEYCRNTCFHPTFVVGELFFVIFQHAVWN
jgi:hypothetical protein